MSAKPAELGICSTWGGGGRRQGRVAAKKTAGQHGLHLGQEARPGPAKGSHRCEHE